MEPVVKWLEAHQGTCSWKQYLGIECPGCGIQTALIQLLKGELVSSLVTFPALIPMMLMLAFLAFHLVVNLPKGALILKILFIFTSSIMILSYSLKLFIH
jgi:hypothetical protein